MTILEQRFLETVPSRLSQLEVGLGQLNENLSRIIERLGKTDKGPTEVSGILHDNSLLQDSPVNNSEKAAGMLMDELRDLDHEELWLLLLNQSLKPIRKVRLCVGNMTSTITDYRRIAIESLNAKATSVIAYHNHPSSNVNPSTEDIKATKKMRECLSCFDIALTDHIIIGGNGETYYSFADEKVQSLKTKR